MAERNTVSNLRSVPAIIGAPLVICAVSGLVVGCMNHQAAPMSLGAVSSCGDFVRVHYKLPDGAELTDVDVRVTDASAHAYAVTGAVDPPASPAVTTETTYECRLAFSESMHRWTLHGITVSTV